MNLQLRYFLQNEVSCFFKVLADSQEYEKADKLFAKAVAKDPHNATILVHRGLLQLQWKGDVPKAVEFMKKALEMDDKSGFAYETLATVEVQRYENIAVLCVRLKLR